MSRLFIISKHTSSGTQSDDSPELASYTELGWEIFSSGLHVKNLCFKGDITDKDVIMTHPDRIFMYRGLGPIVVPYDISYLSSFTGQIFDLTREIGEIEKLYNFRILSDHEKKSLKFHDAKLSFVPKKKFACVVLRLRSHCASRGGPIDFWLNKMKDLYELGLDIYCVGKDADKIIPEYVRHVSLEDYVGLISHDLCELSIGPSSGCMLLNHAFGKSNTEVLFFNDDINQFDIKNEIGHLLIFGLQGNLNRQKTQYCNMT